MKIAWIGVGVMGKSMARHLMRAGYEVVVHTRTKKRAEELLNEGAKWAENAKAAAEGAEIAISMVGFPDEVREVHLSAAGVLSAKTLPKVLVDMSTSRPSLAVEIAEAAKARGVGSVDAPVSGGDVGAREGALSIMVGGAAKDVERVMPVLELMGKKIVHQGEAGAGQHTKLVNQILIAANMLGVCEGLVYSKAAGLDATKVIESVGSGAAGSWSINNLGPRIVRGDFNPGFYVEHFIKDLGIALDEAARLGLALPGLALARQMYEAVRAQGHGRLGTQSLYLALERLNGRDA